MCKAVWVVIEGEEEGPVDEVEHGEEQEVVEGVLVEEQEGGPGQKVE
jgi:hypothetical protein